MWTPYNNYLEKLRQKQKENPYYRQALNQQKQLAYPYQKMSEELSHRTHQGYMTEGALADQMLKMNMNITDQQRQIFDNADMQNNQRQENYQNAIDDIEFKRDIHKQQENERKKAEKKAKRNQWINAGSQILGAGAGALIGSPHGGAMIGAQIGSAIGGMAGGIATDTPEYFMQGFQDTLGGLSSLTSLNEEKQFYNKLSSLDIANMGRDSIAELISIIQTNNFDLLDSFYERYNPANINPLSPMPRKQKNPLKGL